MFWSSDKRIAALESIIETQNKLIGDLQEKFDALNKHIEDMDIPQQVEDTINNIDMEQMAQDFIEEAINNASISVRF